MGTDKTRPSGEPLAGGRLHAEISNAAVRIHREFLGRGPDRARTTIAEGVVVILLQDTLTKAEQSLVAAGRHDDVLRVRHTFQQTIRAELVDAVEQLTGRTVAAFMSANHIDPDLACEVLILSPESPSPGAVGQPDPGTAASD